MGRQSVCMGDGMGGLNEEGKGYKGGTMGKNR